MKQLPDDMLVRRVLAGDTDAFGPIVERYTDLVHATIYEVLGDWDAVDGVAQDTFLAAYRSLGSVLKREHVGAWLYRIARNKALSMVKTAAWHRRTMTSELPADGAPSDAAIATPPAQAEWERADDLRRLVEDGLASLPEDLRTPIVMFYMRDIPARTISEALGAPMRTLERRLQDARKRLRTFLEGRGLADDVAMALKLCVPAGIGSVELAQAVLRHVAGLPTPQSSRAAARSPVAPASAVVGGSMLVGVAVGILALIDATRTVGLPASTPAAHLVTAVRGLPATPSPATVPAAQGSQILAETGGTLSAWRPVDGRFSPTRPIAARDLLGGGVAGFVVPNGNGVRRDFEPVHGVVTLDVMLDPAVFDGAQGEVSLILNGKADGIRQGNVGRAVRVGIWQHRTNRWVYENPSFAAFPSLTHEHTSTDGSQAWVTVGKVRRGPVQLRVVHDTTRGAYDIMIDGEWAARGIAVPSTRGFPVTGVLIAASAGSTASAVRVAEVRVTVAPAGGPQILPPDVELGAPVVNDPAARFAEVRDRVTDKRLESARSSLSLLAELHPKDARTGVARELVRSLADEEEAASEVRAVRLKRWRARVAAIPTPTTTLSPADAERAFDAWARSETDLRWVYFDRDWSGQGIARACTAAA